MKVFQATPRVAHRVYEGTYDHSRSRNVTNGVAAASHTRVEKPNIISDSGPAWTALHKLTHSCYT